MVKTNLKILHISGEISPFIEYTQVAKHTFDMLCSLQKKGVEARAIVPFSSRFNERRHVSHYITRLMKVPIVFEGKKIFIHVRVGTIPKTKVQVYFVHSDEYFTSDFVLNKIDSGNDEDRIIFFSKAVIEVIKILSLVPDIVQCNDWITSLIPFYLKNSTNEIMSFRSKSIFIKYGIENNFKISEDFISKIMRNGEIKNTNIFTNTPIIHLEDLVKIGLSYADFVIFTDNTPKELYPHTQSYSFDISNNFIEKHTHLYNEIQDNIT